MVNIREVFGKHRAPSSEVAAQEVDMAAIEDRRQTELARNAIAHVIKVVDMNNAAEEVPVIGSAQANEIGAGAYERAGKHMKAVEKALESDDPDNDTAAPSDDLADIA